MLHADRDDGIVVLTLNRPAKLNSLDPELVCRLADAWDADRRRSHGSGGDRDRRRGPGVLHRRGPRTADPVVHRRATSEDDWDRRLQADPRLLDKALLRRTDFAVPVIAAVRGFALAGGMELLLGTDLRIAAEDSEFGLTEVTRGIIPAGGGLARLARQVPWAKAAEIVLVGDRISAHSAAEMGLVNRLVPSVNVLGEAMHLARRMARQWAVGDAQGQGGHGLVERIAVRRGVSESSRVQPEL